MTQAFVTDRRGRRQLISDKLNVDMLIDACERRMFSLDSPGFCIVCGNEQDGCEPDARALQCEACGTFTVYGADELAIAMM